MIGKLLGLADIITALLFSFYMSFGFFPPEWVFGFGIYLLVKGGLFSLSLDIASIIDVICAIIIISSVYFGFVVSGLITGLVCIYLLIKGVMSILL